MNYHSSKFCLNILLLVLELRDCDDCVEEFVEAAMCGVCSDVEECFVFLPEGCNHCGEETYYHCKTTG